MRELIWAFIDFYITNNNISGLDNTEAFFFENGSHRNLYNQHDVFALPATTNPL